MYRRWPPKHAVLRDAYVGKKKTKAGRTAFTYRCALCSKVFVKKDVHVDHIIPVVDPSKGFEDWNAFIERLFCERENLQVACRKCHTKKTNRDKKNKGTSGG